MRTIATGLLALALTHGSAAAQTAGEQAQILRDFPNSVAEYMQRHRLDMCAEAANAATPAPRIFPLPTALEYRLIGHDLVIRDNEADIIVAVLRNAVGPALTVIR